MRMVAEDTGMMASVRVSNARCTMRTEKRLCERELSAFNTVHATLRLCSPGWDMHVRHTRDMQVGSRKEEGGKREESLERGRAKAGK